ncbi:MAG: FAD:protein FMN transferase [Acidobacteria bacterium]|nr:FAD:protein FMN transferase [Acidobacteriota bacterium]MBI3656283.1 FAD:protein FMN transferase [Acidobacteriota bacterium]
MDRAMGLSWGRNKPARRFLPIVLPWLAAIFYLLTQIHGRALSPKLERFEFCQGHMGTQFRMILYANSAAGAQAAAETAFTRIAQLDLMMSDYLEDSELTAVGRQASGPPIPVCEELFRVLKKSQVMSKRSQGAFDITVGPVVQLWRRARRTAELPDPARLSEAMALTGHRKMHLYEQTRSVRLAQSGMRLDLGGIAKGYAADEAIVLLKKRGITRALVAAGGDIVVAEAPPGTEGWVIGVASLNSQDEPSACHLLLRHSAVSTSGDAEQHVTIGGIRFSHIINPKTGMALTGRRRVTVVARDGITADALATALCVMGSVRGLQLIETTSGAAAQFEEESETGKRTTISRRWSAFPKSCP